MKDASGEVMINFRHETIRTRTENDGAFSNKWNKVVTVLEFAQGVEAEVEAIADKWAKRNAEAVKTYFDIIERHSKRSPQASFANLQRFFEDMQREKKAQAAAVVIEDVDANDEPDEREYFDVVPDDDDDDDDELDDGKIDELAATKETTALVAVAGTEKETRYEVEYFVYKKDGFIHRYGMLDYTSRLNDALELARRDAEIRGTAEDFGGATITRFVNGSGTVIVDLKREGTIKTYDSEVDQILDAIENGAFEETVQTEQPATARATETSTETALTIYIPRLETVEVKTAVELAEDEYRAAYRELDKAIKIEKHILNQCGEYNIKIDELCRKLRKIEASYKRSTKSATQARLYQEMLDIRAELEGVQEQAKATEKFYDAFSRQYFRAYERKLEAQRNLVTARKAAGLKYSAIVRLTINGKQSHIRANVATIAEAIAFIYQYANDLYSWNIFTEEVEGLTTTQHSVIGGFSFNVESFERMIQRYDAREAIPEAEIAQPSENVEVHYDSPAEEFNAIAFRAMHYFTLDDFITPITELHEFYKRTGYEPAKDELKEWIEMATAAGIEVPADIQADTPESVNVEEYAVTPETQDAAIEAEIENATTAVTETPAHEPADIHCDWLVETIRYYGGFKTRKIGVVQTITVASVDEAREFITMNSDKHLAPLSINDRNYCGQRMTISEYSDLTLNVRNYTYGDVRSYTYRDSRKRRPIVFEIDDFNGSTGTFAEFYVDGEITVIRVDLTKKKKQL